MTFPKRTIVITLATTAAAAITVVAASSPRASAASVESSQSVEPSIVGAWQTRVRPRNCETGEVAPIPGLRGLFTFHEGGTASEYGIPPGIGMTPATRSPGHGVWRREHGWQRYSYAFTFYRYDATGAVVGRQRVVSALELDARGESFESNSSVQVFDASDTLVMTACAYAEGSRFQ